MGLSVFHIFCWAPGVRAATPASLSPFRAEGAHPTDLGVQPKLWIKISLKREGCLSTINVETPGPTSYNL